MNNTDTIAILKRLIKRMRAKASRMRQTLKYSKERKLRNPAAELARANTWDLASIMLELEIDSLEKQ